MKTVRCVSAHGFESHFFLWIIPPRLSKKSVQTPPPGVAYLLSILRCSSLKALLNVVKRRQKTGAEVAQQDFPSKVFVLHSYIIKRCLNGVQKILHSTVVSSSISTVGSFREVAQLGRALALGARGRRFESCLPDRGPFGDLAIPNETLVS